MTQPVGPSAASSSKEQIYLVNLGVKVSPEVFASFRKMAMDKGVPVSELARHVISAHINEPSTLSLMKVAMREVMGEFRKNANPSNN